MADKFVGPEKPNKQYFKTAEERRRESNPWIKESVEKRSEESVVSDKGPVMPESVKKSRENEKDYFNTSTNPIAEEIIRENAPKQPASDTGKNGIDADKVLKLKAENGRFNPSIKGDSFKSRYDDSIIGRLQKMNDDEKQKKLEAENNRKIRIREDFKRQIKPSTFEFSRSNNVFDSGNGLKQSSKEYYISSGRLKGDKNAVYDWNDLNDFLKSFQSAVNKAGKGNSFTEIADSNKLAGDAARELHTAIRQFESANGFLPAVFEDIYSDLPRLRDEYYKASTGGASVKGIDADVLARTNDAISQSVNQLYSPVKDSKYTIDRGIDRTKLSNMPVSNELGAKGIHDIAIKDLTDDQIRTLVLNDVFDFEQMKKAGLGELASYIQSRYNNANSSIYRKNPDGSYVKDAGLDRAGMFIRKTGDAARDTLEQYAGGILNAGLSLADIVSDDYRIKSVMDNMDTSADDDYKFDAMPEGQKTAATLLGGTVQILPTIAANIVMPGAGMAVMGTSIYGNSYAEARKNGASEGEAAFNGFLNATAEMLIEKFAGGIPGLGEGATSKYVASVGRFFNSEPAQRIARVLFEAGGEGVEEVLSYFAEPIIDGISLKNPDNWEYSTRNLAMNFLGGFLGSALFGGGVEIVGLKASPSKEAKSTADAAIKKFGSLAYTKGIADEKTQKAAQDAIKAIERIGYFDKDNNTYTVPGDIANMLNASELMRKNPNSANSLALNQVYESMKKVVFDDTSEEFKTAVIDGKISRNEVNALRKISSGARVNVNFVAIPEFIDGAKNPDYDYGNFTVDENGAHINININGKDPLFQTALHDIVHALKASEASNGGGRFTILQNNVLQILSEYPELVNSLDAITRERYKNVLTGNKASDNAILEEEIIADVLARVLNNRDIIKYYAQQDMGTLARIFDNIRTFFENSSQRYNSMSKQKNDPYSLAAEKLNEYSESIGEMFKGSVGDTFSYDSSNNDIRHSMPFDEEMYRDMNGIVPSVDAEQRILNQGRIQAGLDPNALYDESVSLKQSDIDERNGHTFTIPDENALHQQSQYRDKFNNSLHLADSVVFQYNNGVDEVYGTGRILSFYDGSEGGVAKITVDSGDLAQRDIEIDTNRLMFIAHNDTQTIGHDFTSELDIFKKAKPAWDEFVQTGDIGPIMQLHFKDIRYLYGLTNNRISILQNQIKSKVKQYDEGIAFDAVADRLDTKTEREAYSSYALLAELYHSVRLANFLKPIYEIHVANGGQVVDIARAIRAATDYDQGNPFKMVIDKIKSLNRPVTIKGKKYRFDPKNIPKIDFLRKNVFSSGNYMFNTPRANFERTLGPYASVFTSVLDSLEQRGCDYAKAVTEWHTSIQEICKKYNVKPGDDFSAAIQMLGEGRFVLDMRNKKMKALFERFDLPLDSINTKTGIASGFFNLGHVIHIFGKERAQDAVELVNYFRGAYAEFLKRINETMAYIYPGQPDRLVRPKKDYFRHFTEVSDGLLGLMQTLSSDIQIDPTLVGKTDRTKPKKSWESPLAHRTGDTVYPDAVGGFLDYIPHVEYFININPSVKDFRLLREFFGEVKQDFNDTSANSFINWLDVFTNHLAKKTIGLDRILTDLFPKAGRVILSFAKRANNFLSKNQLFLNASVMLKQVGNIDNAIIYMQNPSGLLNSMFGIATAYTTNPELKKKYVELFKLSPFLTQRGLDPDFKLRKAGAEKIAGDMLNLGDDFGCKVIWLACYREGQSLNTPDPVRYADDITRRCVAGRGIGEKPLIFTSELSRLFLPYLLEANNNRSVMRDAVFDLTDNSKGENFEFDDKNSYLYYNHQKSSGGKFASRSFKAALWLLVTFAGNELLRKILNQDMDIDLIDDLRTAYKGAFKDDGSFDLSKFAKGSLSNISDDFLEHGNFSWVYDLLFALAKEDPTEAVNALSYSVPIISSIASPVKNIARGDYLGAGLDIITSYVTPFGGSQIKKTFNGLWDYYQGANYWHRPTEQLQNLLGHNVLPKDVASKIGWNGSIKGGKGYDIEKNIPNFIRGAFFGQSAFPENKEYWDAQDAKNKSKAEAEKLKERSINDFALSLKGTEFDVLYDLWNETENYAALPIKDKIWDNISFENNQDRKFEAVLTDEEKQKYSEMFTEKLKPVYLEIINSDKFKNADVDGKIKLLKDANDAEWKYFNQDYIQSDVMAREYLETYKGKYGDDELIQLYNASGDAAYLPSFDIYKNLRAYAEDGSEHRTTLTDEQLAYYNDIGVQKVHDAMYGVINSPDWANLTPEQKSDKLRVAKLHAEKEVEEYAQKDFLYKDIITKYNDTHGEDDPIRRAYATTHDPEVYPFIAFNETQSVNDDNFNSVRYTLSLAPGADGSESEFAHFKKYANENFAMNLDRFVQAGYFNNLSDEQIHSKIMDLKNEYVGKALNNVIKNYIREKLGIAYRHQFR